MSRTDPKSLLANRDLIGFTRRPAGGGQVACRASSAKVLKIDEMQGKLAAVPGESETPLSGGPDPKSD